VRKLQEFSNSTFWPSLPMLHSSTSRSVSGFDSKCSVLNYSTVFHFIFQSLLNYLRSDQQYSVLNWHSKRTFLKHTIILVALSNSWHALLRDLLLSATSFSNETAALKSASLQLIACVHLEPLLNLTG
jgi:hypothetical protein